MYVSPTQVNALIPRNLGPNTQHQVIVKRGSNVSVPVQITVADIAPGIYTVNAQGTGQGVITIGDTGVLAAPAGENARPVRRGETVVLLLTGLGAVENAPPDGVLASVDALSPTVATPVVTMGDAKAQVQFSGLAPGAAGNYMVKAVVPDDALSGDAVTLMVTMNGVPSNPVPIAIQ